MTDGTPTCTERMCIWQGIPECYSCKSGYSLVNKQCVNSTNSCVQEGGYAGGGHVVGPENPDDFMCCSGLTRAERNNGTTFADAGYICIREGDGICNSEYEGASNSSDCQTTTVLNTDICQTYYDGCNSCSKTTNGTTVCTMMSCVLASPAYCTSYIPYSPQTETEDRVFLGNIELEFRNYAKDISCTFDDQCKWQMTGARACGGPSVAIPYSTQNINVALLQNKADYFTSAQKSFNTHYEIVSDCMMTEPPAPRSCINNFCQ